jgi:hypothetical protein
MLSCEPPDGSAIGHVFNARQRWQLVAPIGDSCIQRRAADQVGQIGTPLGQRLRSASKQSENVVTGNRRFQQPIRRDFANVSNLVSNGRDLPNCALKTLFSISFIAQP